MVKIKNPLGFIEISTEYFTSLVGSAVTSCYGVAEMATSDPVQGIRALVQTAFPDKGVKVRNEPDGLVVDLHIVVTYGVNITAITKSIVHKVRYAVEQATGLNVKAVNVFVDSLKTE